MHSCSIQGYSLNACLNDSTIQFKTFNENCKIMWKMKKNKILKINKENGLLKFYL